MQKSRRHRVGNNLFHISKSCKLLGKQQHLTSNWVRTSESSRTGPDAAAPPLAEQSQSRERESSIISNPRWLMRATFCVGARTLAGNTVPPEVSTKQTLRESGWSTTGPINQRAINWSTQPLVSATTAVNQVNRLQQQIVENQVSTWPTRYLVLGGFTPGTPVSTPFFQKIRKEHTKEKIKRDKRKDSKRQN